MTFSASPEGSATQTHPICPIAARARIKMMVRPICDSQGTMQSASGTLNAGELPPRRRRAPRTYGTDSTPRARKVAAVSRFQARVSFNHRQSGPGIFAAAINSVIGSGIQIPDWDRGKDFAGHPRLAFATHVDICFGWPRSPSQEGAAMSRLNVFAGLRYPWTSLVGSPRCDALVLSRVPIRHRWPTK
jgi:hypothetical protein